MEFGSGPGSKLEKKLHQGQFPHVGEDPLASLPPELAQCSELSAITVSGGASAGLTIGLPGWLLVGWLLVCTLHSKPDVVDGSRQRQSGERKLSLPPCVSLGKSLFPSEPWFSHL